MSTAYGTDSNRAPRLWVCYDDRDDGDVRPELSWLSHQGFRHRLRGAQGTEEAAFDVSRRCEHVLLYASARALRNDGCQAEIAEAVRTGKPVVVVALEPLNPSNTWRRLFRELPVIVRHGVDRDAYRRELYATLVASAAAAAPIVDPHGGAEDGGALFAGAGAAALVLVAVAAGVLLLREPAEELPDPGELLPGGAQGLSLDAVRQPARFAVLEGSASAGVRFSGDVFPEHRIDLDLEGASLEEALVRIAEQVQLRLVTSGRLGGRVDLREADAAWDAVLDGLAQRHGLAVEVTDDTIYVAAVRAPEPR